MEGKENTFLAEVFLLLGLLFFNKVMAHVQMISLKRCVIQAVKNKKFHIYSVSTIEEGIEVLTGVPAGKKDKNGKFPAGTVNYLVYEKLKKYASINQKN